MSNAPTPICRRGKVDETAWRGIFLPENCTARRIENIAKDQVVDAHMIGLSLTTQPPRKLPLFGQLFSQCALLHFEADAVNRLRPWRLRADPIGDQSHRVGLRRRAVPQRLRNDPSALAAPRRSRFERGKRSVGLPIDVAQLRL